MNHIYILKDLNKTFDGKLTTEFDTQTTRWMLSYEASPLDIGWVDRPLNAQATSSLIYVLKKHILRALKHIPQPVAIDNQKIQQSEMISEPPLVEEPIPAEATVLDSMNEPIDNLELVQSVDPVTEPELAAIVSQLTESLDSALILSSTDIEEEPAIESLEKQEDSSDIAVEPVEIVETLKKKAQENESENPNEYISDEEGLELLIEASRTLGDVLTED